MRFCCWEAWTIVENNPQVRWSPPGAAGERLFNCWFHCRAGGSRVPRLLSLVRCSLPFRYGQWVSDAHAQGARSNLACSPWLSIPSKHLTRHSAVCVAPPVRSFVSS